MLDGGRDVWVEVVTGQNGGGICRFVMEVGGIMLSCTSCAFLDGLLEVLVKGVKLVKILLNLVFSHGWIGLNTQPTPKEEWGQECSCSKDHSSPLGEELEKVSQMTRCREELELGDEVIDTNMLKKPSEKHSIGKCHIDTLGYTYHSVGDVVGKVEVFFDSEASPTGIIDPVVLLIRRFVGRGNKPNPRDVKIASLKQRIQELEFPQLQQDSSTEEAETESNVWDNVSEDVNPFGGGNHGFHDDHYDNPFLTKETESELIIWDIGDEEEEYHFVNKYPKEESMSVYDTDIEGVIEEEEGFVGK
nr:hypothetical protein [Tanacetum cinerariifolium]